MGIVPSSLINALVECETPIWVILLVYFAGLFYQIYLSIKDSNRMRSMHLRYLESANDINTRLSKTIQKDIRSLTKAINRMKW